MPPHGQGRQPLLHQGAVARRRHHPSHPARTTDLGETWQFSVAAKPVEREFTRFDGTKVTALERFNYARVATHPTDPTRLSVGFVVSTAEALTPCATGA